MPIAGRFVAVYADGWLSLAGWLLLCRLMPIAGWYNRCVSAAYLLLSLEHHHSAPLVPSGQKLPRGVELNCGDDVSWKTSQRTLVSQISGCTHLLIPPWAAVSLKTVINSSVWTPRNFNVQGKQQKKQCQQMPFNSFVLVVRNNGFHAPGKLIWHTVHRLWLGDCQHRYFKRGTDQRQASLPEDVVLHPTAACHPPPGFCHLIDMLIPLTIPPILFQRFRLHRTIIAYHGEMRRVWKSMT